MVKMLEFLPVCTRVCGQQQLIILHLAARFRLMENAAVHNPLKYKG